MRNDLIASETAALRRAELNDATAILQVNHDAAHALCGDYYSSEVLTAWAPLSHARLEHWQKYIETPQEQALMLVATLAGKVVGFGRIVFSTGELTSLYVAPEAAGRAIGRTLLKALEEEALRRGLSSIWLTAALNAQRFYAANGFHAVETIEYKLSNELAMSVVKMEKQFSTDNIGNCV